MYLPGGVAYIYFVYGMYHMFNIVTGPKDHPEAVLIRAGECLSHPDLDLSGPGKFTRELGLDRAWNSKSLCSKSLYFRRGTLPLKISKSARIGVAYAGAWAPRKLRFFDPASDAVS